MVEISLALFTGCLIFISTGTDDLMVMVGLMNGSDKKQVRMVFWGTLFGTIVMFTACVLLTLGLGLTLKSHEYLRFAGLVPIVLGMRYYWLSTQPSEEVEVSTSPKFWPAMLVYLGNSSDDLIVNSSKLLTVQSYQIILGLLIGNLLGVWIYFMIAKFLTGYAVTATIRKIIWRFAAMVLIFIGLHILIA